MDYEELRKQAARTVEKSDCTQLEIGEKLDVSSGAMSRALSESGQKFASLQRRIIECLTPYRVSKKTLFIASKIEKD